MKKILLLLVVLSAAAFNSFAQSSKGDGSGKFSIGVDPGLPVGNASDVSSFAIGGDLKYSLPAAENFDVSLSAGYTTFIGKTVTIDFNGQSVSGKASDIKAIPVKLGGRYNFDGASGFFGEVAFGAAFIQDGGGTAFLYAPGIGYAMDGGFEVGLRYEGWSKNGSFSQIGLRVAYSFQ
jgi:hypothetical protein